MNLISQNCLAGNLYKFFIKEKFSNPFIWTVIDFNSMYYLIKNWGKINFHNYELTKDKNWNFSIIIDNNIKIQYVHYKFDINENKPIKKWPGDICYNKIWEYIIQKYEERLTVMEQFNSKPIFCICNFDTIFKDAIYTENQLDILSKFNNVKILKGCEKLSPFLSTQKFFNIFF